MREYFELVTIEVSADAVLLPLLLLGETYAELSNLLSNRPRLLRERSVGNFGPVALAALFRRHDLIRLFLTFDEASEEFLAVHTHPSSISIALGDVEALKLMWTGYPRNLLSFDPVTSSFYNISAQFGHLSLLKKFLWIFEHENHGNDRDAGDDEGTGGQIRNDKNSSAPFDVGALDSEPTFPEDIFNASHRDLHINADFGISWLESAVQGDQLQVLKWALSTYYGCSNVSSSPSYGREPACVSTSTSASTSTSNNNTIARSMQRVLADEDRNALIDILQKVSSSAIWHLSFEILEWLLSEEAEKNIFRRGISSRRVVANDVGVGGGGDNKGFGDNPRGRGVSHFFGGGGGPGDEPGDGLPGPLLFGEDGHGNGLILDIAETMRHSEVAQEIWRFEVRFEKVARWLVEKVGLDVLKPGFKGRSVLEVLCRDPFVEPLQMLIDKFGVDMKTVVLDPVTNDTPFTVALRSWMKVLQTNPHSEPDVLRLLVAHGCSVNVRYREEYMTPVIEASREGSLKAVKILVEEFGADLTLCKPRASALDHACAKAHKDIAHWIFDRMEADGTLYKVLNSQLVSHCLARDLLDLAMVILKRYPKLADRDKSQSSTHGTTVLDSALRLNLVDFAIWLLDEQPTLGVTLEAHYSVGTLAWCVRLRNTAAVELIVSRIEKNNAILDERILLADHSSVSLLCYAAGVGALEIVKILVEIGGIKVSNSIADHAPAFMALINGKSSVLRYFVDHCGVNLVTDTSCVELLYLAAAGEKLDEAETRDLFHFLLDELLPKEALDYTDSRGRTPLIHAADHGRSLVVRILLEHGAHWNWQDEAGFDAPGRAILGNHLATVKVLFEFGGANLFGPHHLHIAVASGSIECFDYLFDTVFKRIFIPSSAKQTSNEASSSTRILHRSSSHPLELNHLHKPFHSEKIDRIQELLISAAVGHQYEMLEHFVMKRHFNRPGLHWHPHLNLDFRIGWQGPSQLWKLLYCHGLVGQLLNASIFKLKEARLEGEHDAFLSKRIPFSTTHLHSVLEACATHNLTWLKALYECGADLQIETPSGLTPLIAAAQSGSLPIVTWLISKGCSPFERTILGTPLSRATSRDVSNFLQSLQ